MICANCQTANPDGAKFCMQCGNALAVVCRTCGTPLPSAVRFCHHCGAAISPDTPRPASAELQRLQQYIPKALLEKLEAARTSRSMEGERRVVTVLFCDVKGSTAIAEKLDPEDWAEIMNGAFEHLIAPVYRYEGTVARLMGDSILAFFGAPIAHEDDPQRAVLAGLGIMQDIAPYRDKIWRQRGLEFDVRVGINTGLVVVGEVGSDLRVEYTVMGDAVNLAARMEQTAQPGTVQISGHTHKLIAPLFEFESLGGIEVKGKAEPVTAFRVLGVKAQPGRLRGIQGLHSPLIGRESEKTKLQSAVGSLRAGRGQIVCLIGEAGLGKSRLTGEVRAEWRDAAHWSESRSVSYDTHRPYGQFIAQLYGLIKASESDPVEGVRRKLAAFAESVLPAVAARASVAFEIMLGIFPEGQPQPLAGEAFKRELFEMMTAAVRQWTSEPSVMVFDDLHWADPASIELLQHLLQLTDSAPVLFLCIFRPDRQAASWQIKTLAEKNYQHRYTEIGLSPLSLADSNALVDSLLAVANLPPKLRQQILEKAEGNPLFVEEVVRELIDSGMIVRDEAGGETRWRAVIDEANARITIPDNLQALLSARIDRLEDDARRVLQLAAVIGRSFYYRVLQLICDTADGLDNQLNVLQRADLIRELSRLPEVEYIFRHALTQEAAYNSILLKRRREFHLRVGETMERLFPNRLEEYAPMLAFHFYEANDGRALRYFVLAGDAAARLYANAEAAAHFRRALDVADPASIDSNLMEHIHMQLGQALELCARQPEALDVYEALETYAIGQNDKRQQFTAVAARAKIYSTPNVAQNAAQGHQLLGRALSLARDLDDAAAQAQILWNMMLLIVFSDGDAHQAVAYGEESLAIARRHQLREQLAFTLNDLYLAYVTVGDAARARQVQTEARPIWRELNNLPMLADNLAAAAVGNYLVGNYAESIQFAEEAYQICESIDNKVGKATTRFMLGNVYLDYGEVDTALRKMREGVEWATEAGHPGPLVITRADLAYTYAWLGFPDVALPEVEKSYTRSESGMASMRTYARLQMARIYMALGDMKQAKALMTMSEPECRRNNLMPVHTNFCLTAGEMAMLRGEFEEVIALADEAVSVDYVYPLQKLLPDVLLLKAKAQMALGDVTGALATLDEADSIATRLNSRRTLWQIYLAQSNARPDEAVALRHKAKEMLEYMISHIPHRDEQGRALRQRFTEQEAVRALLG